MKKSIEKRIKELTEKAKQTGVKSASFSRSVHNRSSLHRIIKTKEQADAFMRQLKSL
jgi:hypothetical protein